MAYSRAATFHRQINRRLGRPPSKPSVGDPFLPCNRTLLYLVSSSRTSSALQARAKTHELACVSHTPTVRSRPIHRIVLCLSSACTIETRTICAPVKNAVGCSENVRRRSKSACGFNLLSLATFRVRYAPSAFHSAPDISLHCTAPTEREVPLTSRSLPPLPRIGLARIVTGRG